MHATLKSFEPIGILVMMFVIKCFIVSKKSSALPDVSKINSKSAEGLQSEKKRNKTTVCMSLPVEFKLCFCNFGHLKIKDLSSHVWFI